MSFLTERQKSEDEVALIKKSLRQKEAEFLKEKALLIQQVELLKLQLQESNERESNIKKVNENIMIAFQNEQDSSKNNQFTLEINEDHPRVQELLRCLKQDHKQLLLSEKERHRDYEYTLERENQQLSFKVMEQQKHNESLVKQLENTLKEQITRDNKHKDEIKAIEIKIRSECESQMHNLQQSLSSLQADIDLQVTTRLNQKYVSDQVHNQSVIELQRQMQTVMSDNIDKQKRIDSLERELQQINEGQKKTEDENGALRYKMKSLEKKLKEETDTLKRQKEEAVKRCEILEQQKKGTSKNTKQMNSMGPPPKSRNNQILNKENISSSNKTHLLSASEPDLPKQEDPEEEKNKLRRQLSLLRCQLKKLEIDLKDQKTKLNQEIASLKDKLNVERKKRMNIYEDKIDKNQQLLQDLLEKDQTIFALNRQITKLQEQIASLMGENARSNTPNHLMGMSLQESMINQGFTQSMVDLNSHLVNKRNQNSSKRLISPLRSLDLTMLNNNLNTISFSQLPKTKKTNRPSTLKKKGLLVASPKQIKRNRISQTMTSSLNGGLRLKPRSRDGSIQEVNEDLYKDSVDSMQHQDNEDIDLLQNQNIMLQFGNPTKVQSYYTLKDNTTLTSSGNKQNSSRQDLELRNALQIGKVNKENEIYYDSLDNSSQRSENEEVNRFYQKYQEDKKKYNTQALVTSNRKKNSLLMQQTQKQAFMKHQAFQSQEEDDCLVNILEQGDDTHIETAHPTLTHPRQNPVNHFSTENLFKEAKESMRGHSQRGGVVAAMARNNTRMIPKPQTNYQQAAVQKINSLKESYDKLNFSSIRNSQQKPHNVVGEPSLIMRSPSSPNMMQVINQKSSSSNKQGHKRQDSCPSPLDEDETVVMLGSGEKLRIKEMSMQNFDMYQNQFKEQRHKFSATIKPPTNKQAKRPLQESTKDQQQFGFRTRTNSLINSCCSEISFKMKFIRDMPLNEPLSHREMNQVPQTQKHQRVPSMQLNSENKQQKVIPGMTKAFSYNTKR